MLVRAFTIFFVSPPLYVRYSLLFLILSLNRLLQEVPARVGLRRYLAASNGESGACSVPTQDILRVDDLAGPSTSTPPSSVKVTDYLVGVQLDEALAAGQDVIVSWPFEEGDIKDYVQAEALWYALLVLIQV